MNHQGDLAHNQMLVEVVENQHRHGHTGVLMIANSFVASRLPSSASLAAFDGQHLTDDLKLSGILGVHAEETETALIMRWFPELVDYQALSELEPTHLGPEDLAEWRKGGEIARRVTPQGYLGSPKPVDPFLWRFYERWAAAIADVIAERLAGNRSWAPRQ